MIIITIIIISIIIIIIITIHTTTIIIPIPIPIARSWVERVAGPPPPLTPGFHINICFFRVSPPQHFLF